MSDYPLGWITTSADTSNAEWHVPPNPGWDFVRSDDGVNAVYQMNPQPIIVGDPGHINWAPYRMVFSNPYDYNWSRPIDWTVDVYPKKTLNKNVRVL